MTVNGYEANRSLIKATKTVLRRRGLLKSGFELKGTQAALNLKEEVHKSLSNIDHHVYSTTFDKRTYPEYVADHKERLYNFMARVVIGGIPLDKETSRIALVVDKSKNKAGIREFNQYIENSLEGVIGLGVPLDITHSDSCENYGLQIVDLYSWGIFRKYESNDLDWLETYKHIVNADELIV